MIRRGFTIIELLLVMSLSTIIITICFSIYIINMKEFYIINKAVDENANTRIAMDFLVEHLREGNIVVIGTGDITIDGDRIYIKDKILRHGTDSQQIADNISSFEVTKVNTDRLYRVLVSSKGLSMKTLINKRK